jgi:hypothetical protein
MLLSDLSTFWDRLEGRLCGIGKPDGCSVNKSGL